MDDDRMSGYGKIDIEEHFDGDPVDDWLSLKCREDVADKTIEELERKLTENKNETGLRQFLDQRDVDVLEATVFDLFDFRDHIREKNSERDMLNRLTEISTFYSEMMHLYNQTDSNPAGYVLSRTDADVSSPDRDYHTVEEMGEYLRSIKHPQLQTMALYYLKYGLRRGAGVNIDLDCVHIDDPRYYEFLEQRGIELHENVKDHPDSIYIYGGFNGGDVVRGEKRETGNKRTHEAILPMDDELVQATLQYLTVRPDTSPPHPLFPQLKPIGWTYDRISPHTVYNKLVTEKGAEFGLTEVGSGRSDFDLHYCRHFFRTQMKRYRSDHDGHLPDDLVKYIRGDVLEEKVMDEIYQHDEWGVKIREPYVNNIYTFGLFD
ncbi:hypothetical protein [Natrinema hispanicum]|uniref:Site-specific recombinase XerD n=1 Tax=Natrinema hispanicum TaxID=392421 RepID=A0A1I0IX13_9EURY|nr:hypothetical protein [Natrinema hispanicum]SEU01097.1 hypothetical protein SAMN04488694_12632 [Natrinema hispanicum]